MKLKTILHVEDNSGDAILVRLALAAWRHEFDLRHVEDGEQAIDYLRSASARPDANRNPSPDLVLLDLKMPRKDGFEVIEWMRRTEPWKQIPIFVLSSSEEPEDVQRATGIGADRYIRKSFSYRELVEAVDVFLHTPPAPPHHLIESRPRI